MMPVKVGWADLSLLVSCGIQDCHSSKHQECGVYICIPFYMKVFVCACSIEMHLFIFRVDDHDGFHRSYSLLPARCMRYSRGGATIGAGWGHAPHTLICLVFLQY